MVTLGCDADQAFEALAKLSSQQNCKLRDVGRFVRGPAGLAFTGSLLAAFTAYSASVVEVVHSMAGSRVSFYLPRRIDPGVATVIAAILALVGTVITVALMRPTSPDAGPGTVVTTSTAVTTSTTVTSGPATPTPSPTVQVVSTSPQQQKDIVQKAAKSVLEAANRLPLLVDGGFDARNAPLWPVGSQTFAGGITCTQAIKNGRWELSLTSRDGGAYCYSGVSHTASDLAVTVGTSLSSAANADVSLYFRASPDLRNYYQVGFNPLTQQFWEVVVVDGKQSTLIAPTFAPELRKNGPNVLSVVVVGSSQTLYANDKVVALVSGESRITAPGKTAIQLQLHEANRSATLEVNRFELHGQSGVPVPARS